MTEQFLTVSELRRLTKESESAWRKRLLRGEVRYYKLGSSVRVSLEDVQTWLQTRAVIGKTSTETV
jgi:excisionase family DNA binding protein